MSKPVLRILIRPDPNFLDGFGSSYSDPDPDKSRPDPQHWSKLTSLCYNILLNLIDNGTIFFYFL